MSCQTVADVSATYWNVYLMATDSLSPKYSDFTPGFYHITSVPWHSLLIFFYHIYHCWIRRHSDNFVRESCKGANMEIGPVWIANAGCRILKLDLPQNQCKKFEHRKYLSKFFRGSHIHCDGVFKLTICGRFLILASFCRSFAYLYFGIAALATQWWPRQHQRQQLREDVNGISSSSEPKRKSSIYRRAENGVYYIINQPAHSHDNAVKDARPSGRKICAFAGAKPTEWGLLTRLALANARRQWSVRVCGRLQRGDWERARTWEHVT